MLAEQSMEDCRTSKMTELKYFNGIELKPLTIKLERINEYVTEQIGTHNKYACEICSQTFEVSSDLQRHLITYPLKGPYNCSYCSKSIKNRDVFLHHVRSKHTKLWPFKCSKCFKKFTVEGNRDMHERNYHSILLNCEICQKIFLSKETLEKHMETFHKCDKPFKCQQCSMKFSGRYKLTAHMQFHNESKPHKCKQCGKDFKTSKLLSRHMIIHPDSVFVHCGSCSKKFVTDGLLQRHMKTYHPEVVFTSNAMIPVIASTNEGQSGADEDLPCYECNLRFKSNQDLNQHIGSHYRKGYFPCGICPKKFTIVARLKLHLMMHSNERNFQCEICDKKFNLPGHLKCHLKSHTGEKPFRCNLCPKQFADTKILKNHVTTMHSEVKSYFCTKCPRKFKSTLAFRSHEKKHEDRFFCTHCCMIFSLRKKHREHEALHTNNTGFACTECPKRYKGNHTLKMHMKTTHPSSMSFSCKVCEKKFKSHGVLIVHEKTHLKRKKFSCEQCSQRFSRRGLLEMHVHENHSKRNEKKTYYDEESEVCVKQELNDKTEMVGSDPTVPEKLNEIDTKSFSNVKQDSVKPTRSTKTLISYEETIKIEPV